MKPPLGIRGCPWLSVVVRLKRENRLATLLLAGILAVAATVRFVSLSHIPPGLWYDEAIYALDGLSIGRGNWPIFFTTEGHPREPLYIYSLGAFFAAFGHSVLKARLVSALWGIATVAVFYPFARRVVGRTWALAAVFTLAVFRWHAHFSRTIFRALLPPFFILLVAVFFLRWRERRRPLDALLCGLFMGLGMYTYLSFRFVPLMLACWIGWLLWKGALAWRRDWRHLALIYATAAVVFLPLAIDYARNPWHFAGRMDEVSMFTKTIRATDAMGNPSERVVPKTMLETAAGLAGNALDVAGMWTVRGDHVGKHNLPLEPVFDWASGALFYAGIAWCLINIARNEFAFLTLIWLFFMCLTSMFSFGAPNLLRMQGATPAAVMAFIFGLRWAFDASARLMSMRVRVCLAGLIIAYFAFNQLDTYFRRFPQSTEVQMEFQKQIFYDPAVAVLDISKRAAKVFVPEEMAAHPSFAFVTYGLDNLKSYGASERLSAIAGPGGGRLAVLVTARSLQLARDAGNDQLDALRGMNGARIETETMMPAKQGLTTWAQLWVIP
ncbi:MAG: glycosyltransferase family 39 protein [Candidatus Sumerlaeota bacterium]|nr:glycosyltransferase family 39 protein [Candidatus Sumerlaeota bacterium]